MRCQRAAGGLLPPARIPPPARNASRELCLGLNLREVAAVSSNRLRVISRLWALFWRETDCKRQRRDLKSRIKAQTPNNPGLGCSALATHCAGRAPPCTGDQLQRGNQRLPKGPRAFGQHSTVWAGGSLQHQPLACRVSWRKAGLPPVSPSNPSSDSSLLQAPPSTSSQDMDVLHLQQHPTALKRAAGANAPWVDAAQGWHLGRHTHRPGTKEPSDHWKTKSL